jgi:uncharacterized protein
LLLLKENEESGFDMDISTAFLLLAIGIIAGGYGTIVGAGGGFIFVPALLLVFGMEPAVAAGTGLVTVLINSLSGLIGYAKQKRIQYRTGITIGIGAFPGALLGVWLLQVYSSSYFTVILATLLISLGIFLFWKNTSFLKKKERIPVRDGEERAAYAEEAATTVSLNETKTMQAFPKFLLPLGFLMGILSSYLGIGGGWLLVPVLIYLFKVPTHNATATSIFSLTLYSSVGVISQLFYGNIDWPTVILGGIGVMVGAQLGVYLSNRIPGKVILQMLSALLVVIGFRMYFG